MGAQVVNIAGERSESLADSAYRRLKQRLLDFDYLPGERLSETELAHALALSRTPLRQALQRLQHEGFVESQPRLGWIATPIRFERIEALYDFRILIECFAAQACCGIRGQRRALADLAQTWQCAIEQRESGAQRVGEMDEGFHRALVAMAGNPEVSRTHDEITEKIRIVRRLDFTKAPRIEATYDEHATIIEALKRRRADEASRLLTAHIEQSKIEVRKITLDMLYQARRKRSD